MTPNGGTNDGGTEGPRNIDLMSQFGFPNLLLPPTNNNGVQSNQMNQNGSFQQQFDGLLNMMPNISFGQNMNMNQPGNMNSNALNNGMTGLNSLNGNNNGPNLNGNSNLNGNTNGLNLNNNLTGLNGQTINPMNLIDPTNNVLLGDVLSLLGGPPVFNPLGDAGFLNMIPEKQDSRIQIGEAETLSNPFGLNNDTSGSSSADTTGANENNSEAASKSDNKQQTFTSNPGSFTVANGGMASGVHNLFQQTFNNNTMFQNTQNNEQNNAVNSLVNQNSTGNMGNQNNNVFQQRTFTNNEPVGKGENINNSENAQNMNCDPMALVNPANTTNNMVPFYMPNSSFGMPFTGKGKGGKRKGSWNNNANMNHHNNMSGNMNNMNNSMNGMYDSSGYYDNSEGNMHGNNWCSSMYMENGKGNWNNFGRYNMSNHGMTNHHNNMNNNCLNHMGNSMNNGMSNSNGMNNMMNSSFGSNNSAGKGLSDMNPPPPPPLDEGFLTPPPPPPPETVESQFFSESGGPSSYDVSRPVPGSQQKEGKCVATINDAYSRVVYENTIYSASEDVTGNGNHHSNQSNHHSLKGSGHNHDMGNRNAGSNVSSNTMNQYEDDANPPFIDAHSGLPPFEGLSDILQCEREFNTDVGPPSNIEPPSIPTNVADAVTPAITPIDVDAPPAITPPTLPAIAAATIKNPDRKNEELQTKISNMEAEIVALREENARLASSSYPETNKYEKGRNNDYGYDNSSSANNDDYYHKEGPVSIPKDMPCSSPKDVPASSPKEYPASSPKDATYPISSPAEENRKQSGSCQPAASPGDRRASPKPEDTYPPSNNNTSNNNGKKRYKRKRREEKFETPANTRADTQAKSEVKPNTNERWTKSEAQAKFDANEKWTTNEKSSAKSESSYTKKTESSFGAKNESAHSTKNDTWYTSKDQGSKDYQSTKEQNTKDQQANKDPNTATKSNVNQGFSCSGRYAAATVVLDRGIDDHLASPVLNTSPGIVVGSGDSSSSTSRGGAENEEDLERKIREIQKKLDTQKIMYRDSRTRKSSNTQTKKRELVTVREETINIPPIIEEATNIEPKIEDDNTSSKQNSASKTRKVVIRDGNDTSDCEFRTNESTTEGSITISKSSAYEAVTTDDDSITNTSADEAQKMETHENKAEAEKLEHAKTEAEAQKKKQQLEERLKAVENENKQLRKNYDKAKSAEDRATKKGQKDIEKLSEKLKTSEERAERKIEMLTNEVKKYKDVAASQVFNYAKIMETYNYAKVTETPTHQLENFRARNQQLMWSKQCDLQHDLEKKKSLAKQLLEENQAEKDKVKALEKKLEEAEKRRKKELKEKDKVISEKEMQLEEMDMDLRNKERKVTEVQQEIAFWKRSNSQTDSHKDTLTSELVILKDQLNKQCTENTKLKKDNYQMRWEVATLTSTSA